METEITPKMTKHEVALIKSYLKPNGTHLEWGSGHSTLAFAPHVRRSWSIEHDKEWSEWVTERLPDNAKLCYVPPNIPGTKRPSSYAAYKDYIQCVHSLGVKYFDTVLIDGRARPQCALEVLPYLRHDGIVFIHDYCRRKYYQTILGFYDVCAILPPEKDGDRDIYSLAVLRKHKGCQPVDLGMTFNEGTSDESASEDNT